MLGLSKTPNVLGTRDIEVALNEFLNDAREGEEIWIITPYATMEKLSSLRRIISGAAEFGCDINFVVRDEPGQVTPAVSDLSEAIENGLKLFAYKRLHAKVYWFEEGCIVTSANLVDGSFESSTEIGLIIPTGSLHTEIREWINIEIESGIRRIDKNYKVIKPKNARDSTNKAHCIRCKKSITKNAKKPYCSEHYKSWAKYSNPTYKEKYCHICGKKNESTMSKPICLSCFKSLH